MRRDWMAVSAVMTLAVGSAIALGQGTPAGRGTVPPRPATTPAAPATSEGLAVKNIEKQLENPVTIDAEKTTLEEFIASLRKITTTNITVNWNALKTAGLGRDTPVSLHLKDVPYEHVVKTLLETLPVKDGDPSMRLNYTVGDNTLSITTNAELGKGAAARLYTFAPPGAILGVPRDDASAAVRIVKADLVRAGEPMAAAGHAIAMKGETLVASVSERGHTLINKIKTSLATPLRPGALPPGIALTATARRGTDALARASATQGGPTKLPADWITALAREPRKYAAQGLNVALMAGTAEALAREGGSPDLACTVNDGGVLLIGPKAAIRARTVFAAYDLRDVLRRQAGAAARGGQRGAPPTPAPAPTEVLSRTLNDLKSKVPDGGWTDLDAGGPTPTAIVTYGTTLVVFATADVQRQVSAALQELAR